MNYTPTQLAVWIAAYAAYLGRFGSAGAGHDMAARHADDAVDALNYLQSRGAYAVQQQIQQERFR